MGAHRHIPLDDRDDGFVTDRERAKEALELAQTGDEIGRGLLIVMAAIDKQKCSLSIKELAHIFDCTSEALCEAAYPKDPGAYAIISAKLALEYRPSGYPHPEPKARRLLENAIEDYSTVEKGDALSPTAREG